MKHIFLFILILMLFSCEKAEKTIKLSDITNESSYKITSKKENDTITQIQGQSKQYVLKGYKDIKNNVKVGWWKIKDIKNNYLYEIEYLFLDKNKENQIKFYQNGQLINQFSKYYNVLYSNNGYQFQFYFPENPKRDVKVEFGYITSDGSTPPLRKTIKCKKESCYYTCLIPVKNKDQLIVGMVTEFASENKGNDNVLLSATTMTVNTP